MSNENTPSAVSDVEKQDSEPLEKAKIKRPPGINGSLVLIHAIFFLMFTMGWVNLNNCSVSILIPIYLIVAGFVGCLIKLIDKTTNTYLFNVLIVLVVFYAVWHCLGCYWVYREYQPNYVEKRGEKYCNRTTYLLAFWVLTIQHTLLFFVLLLSACYMLMKGDFKKK